MAKRQTIPEARDPLSAIVGAAEAPSRESRPRSPKPEAPEAGEAEEPTRKMGFRLPVSLCEEIRDAVVALQGPPLHLTVSKFGEEACRRELERLKAEHNDGEAFDKREQAPRTGRPVG